MTDNRIEKIRAEIERLYNQSLVDENRQAELGLSSAACTSYGKSKVCKELLSFIASMQEEPKECMYSKDTYTDEDRKVLCGGCEEDCRFNKKEESVNNGIDLGCGVIWRDEEPVSEDLEEVAQEYTEKGSKCQEELDAFKAGAQWKEQQLVAKAVKVNISNASIVSLPVNCDLKVGDKVLIIKED